MLFSIKCFRSGCGIRDSYVWPQKITAYYLWLTRRNSAVVWRANRVRAEYLGEVPGPGIIEFSNYCRNACNCGLKSDNLKLKRYRLSEEILSSVQLLVKDRLKTVILQSGEDEAWSSLAQRSHHAIKILWCGDSLSVVKSYEEYKMWKEAGADRYLLKIETTDQALYAQLHPGMDYNNRVRCLLELAELGYQVGSGNLVGLKGQTLAAIARDILFFADHDFDMIGIGPFIPHAETDLRFDHPGDYMLTLKVVALTRIITKKAHIPATTALGSLERDYRVEALKAGPTWWWWTIRRLTLRPFMKFIREKCPHWSTGACNNCLPAMAKVIHRNIDYSRGDAIGKGRGEKMGDNLFKTPASNRLHIGIFGRRNTGKSSLINALQGKSWSSSQKLQELQRSCL